MTRTRDPRLAPLRRIVGTYLEVDNRIYMRLECGHSAVTTDTAGHGKRMRCNTCKWEDLKRD